VNTIIAWLIGLGVSGATLAALIAFNGGFWSTSLPPGGGGVGAHSTLPVPPALLFGALAISAAIAVARRRKRKDGAQSASDAGSRSDVE
jgi:hypothetical protein